MTQTAVILAAGMGRRLEELGQSIPKGFLQFGDKPIVEESIQKLIDHGIQKIIIVTGYRAEFYDRLQAIYNDLIITVHNPNYADSGSMYSLYCARTYIDDDFLLLESDLIYEPRALTTVLTFPRDNVILLSGKTNAGDEVYVETFSEQVVAMSKHPTELKQVTGELVGISKISLPLLEKMVQEAMPQFTTSLKVDYETDALVAVAKNYPVYYTLVEDLLWSEIDDHNHLLRAKTQIYPALSRLQ